MSLLCVKRWSDRMIVDSLSCEFEECGRIVQMMGVDVGVLDEIGAGDVARLVTAMKLAGGQAALVWVCYAAGGARVGELVWNADTESWDE